MHIPSWMKLGFRSCKNNVRINLDFLHKLQRTESFLHTFYINKICLHTLYLDRNFVGQAVLRLSVAILHLSALFVSFLRLSTNTESCVP